MNNLTSFYNKIKEFADEHNMINEFMLLGSMNEIGSRDYNYRTLIMIPSSSNISRDLSRPVYSLSFDCVILDKCKGNSELATIISTEENLFVVGQLQDYLIQEDENCYIDDVDVETYVTEDDNVTGALFEITMTFARKTYNAGVDNA